ncbi:hypothetical protein Q8X23_31765, partial [Pseudomonas aeruginosa]|nr:hypothetical protein [Pseudomonas aeruginosa]
AALVDLSTVAGNKISNPPWVKFQSAGWVNFPSAPTRLYGCRCNSQQGTRMLISFDACMNYVENGAFDPAIPDRVVGAGGFGPGEGRAGTIPQAPSARPVEPVSQARVTVVPDTSRLPRTL